MRVCLYCGGQLKRIDHWWMCVDTCEKHLMPKETQSPSLVISETAKGMPRRPGPMK